MLYPIRDRDSNRNMEKEMNKFSRNSQEQVNSCHPDLQIILNHSIGLCPVDFGVSEGHRSIELQQKYFKEGKSKIDGVTKMGKHNYYPSLAADIFPYVNGKADYSPETVTFVTAFIAGVAAILLEKGEISHGLRWGGNWDMDGEILTDQTFDDRPHIELVNL